MLGKYEYMKMPITLFPPWIIKQYNLLKKVVQGYIYLQMWKAVWGRPQAGILANKLLCKCLAPFGYFKCLNTPGLWRHESCPISFTLISNEFGVKYKCKEHVDHLIAAIKSKYKNLTKDWTGKLYCGIKLQWDLDKPILDISMLGYVVKQLQHYKHNSPSCQKNCPYYPQPKQYGSSVQHPIPPNTSPPLSDDNIKHVQ
jgi:hypothetical protein